MLKIGQMIKSMRESENVKRGELCRGLCTEATMCKYESGDLIPDSLFFYAIIQRLGKDPGRIYVMMSNEEADYFKWKEETARAIERKEWEKLEKLLFEREKVTTKLNEMIQGQYDFYLRALILAQKGKEVEKEMSYLKRAIENTVPEFETTDWMKLSVGADEINLILYYLYRLKENGYEIQKDLIEQIGRYMENRITDLLEKAVIYPRYVCAKRILLDGGYNKEERVREEEKALGLLKKTYRIYDLPQILRFLAEDTKALGRSEWIIYEKQGKALEEVMEESGHPYEFRLERWYDTRQKICLINEQFRLNRMQLGMTQEKASEEICAVEHYSRIESGKKKPNRKNYLELAKRLGIGWGYFGGALITDKFELYEKMTKLRVAIVRKKYDLAEELYEELEGEVDLSIAENVQLMEMMRHVMRKNNEDETMEEELVFYWKLLKKTLPEGEVIRDYSTTELELFYQIVRIYKRNGNLEKAIEIVEELSRNYRRREEKVRGDAVLLERFYAGMLNDMARYDESMEVTQRLLQESVNRQEGQIMNGLVNLISENMKGGKIASKEACAKMARQAFYLSDLYEDITNREIIRKQYEREYGDLEEWYG